MKSLKPIQAITWKMYALSQLILISCSSEDEPEIILNPLELNYISAIDIGNVESSTDIQVKFRFSESVEAVSLFIVPTSAVNELTVDRLLSVPDGSFLEVGGSLITSASISSSSSSS